MQARNGSTGLPGAREAAELIRAGTLSSFELVSACLAQIEAIDERVEAWAFLDPDHARMQARMADEAREQGRALGPLHGVPVAIKDNIDTADMPTENGCSLFSGRRPTRDAAVVSLLREAGAVILGKSVTTELAAIGPGKTRNPHDPAHTPGGSSSGSAAAVAAGMVPLALGTQTKASVNRPASFCGVYGFKPSYGTVSRVGVLEGSAALDTVGWFARSIEDIALLGDVLMRYDRDDAAMRPAASPGLAAIAGRPPPVTPRVAFVRTPVWDRATADTREAFAELVEVLGGSCDEVVLPDMFARAPELIDQIMCPDLAKNFQGLIEKGGDSLAPAFLALVEAGRKVTAVEYNRALEWRAVFNRSLSEIFDEFDAIVTPAAPGEAPPGLEATGDPVFSAIWTLCGLPSLSVPVMQGSSGLPIGVQVIGAAGDDARLLRTARWFAGAVDPGVDAGDREVRS